MPKKPHPIDALPPLRAREQPGPRKVGVDGPLLDKVLAALPMTAVPRATVAYRLAILIDGLAQTYVRSAKGGSRAKEKRARLAVAKSAIKLLWALDALDDAVYDQLRCDVEVAGPLERPSLLRDLDRELRHLCRVIGERAAVPIRRGPPTHGPDDQAIFQIAFTYEQITGLRTTNWQATVPIEDHPDPDRDSRRVPGSSFARFARLVFEHAGIKLGESRLRTALDKHAKYIAGSSAPESS